MELHTYLGVPVSQNKEDSMAKKARKSARGRKQDRARVAGGQDYEVRYTAKKTRKSASAVKKAVRKSAAAESREGSRAETVGPKHIGTVGGCGIPPLGQS